MSRRGFSKVKPCPVPGCPEKVPSIRYFCWPHWSALPMAMQEEFLDTQRKDGHAKALAKVPNAVSFLERKNQPKPEEVQP